MAVGQDEEIAANASHYLLHLSWGFLGGVFFECLKRYLQAQGKTFPIMIISSVTTLLAIPLDYLFIYVLDFQYLGGG